MNESDEKEKDTCEKLRQLCASVERSGYCKDKDCLYCPLCSMYSLRDMLNNL